MYSQNKIQAVLEAFEKSEGWMPQYHTLEETEEFKAYIDSIVTIESNSKGSWIQEVKPISVKRQKEVTRWIENEIAMCAIDSGYFESRYAYITDECGTVRKFQNRKSQEVLDSVIADLEDRGFGIELLILGSRQNGTSTKILLKFLHRTLFVPNTTTLLCSVTHEKTEYMERVLSVSYDKMPWWLVPIRMPKGAFGNQSRITPQSGRASGIAQGYTPQCVYVTGVDYLPTPVKTIEEGLLRAIHSSRNTFLVLHGMKDSESGYLADLYRHSKKYWSQGKSRLCPIFIPWVMCTDLYPQAEWLRHYPIPTGWKPILETQEHKKKCEKFIHSTPYLAKIAGSDWKMPKEQQWYWESQYSEAKARNTLDSFNKHFAPDDGDTLAEPEVVTDEEIDMETLFPQPVAMQEKVAAARKKLEGK